MLRRNLLLLSSGLLNLYPTASGSSALPVIFYQARQYHIPKDSILCCVFTKTTENMYTIMQLCYINAYLKYLHKFCYFQGSFRITSPYLKHNMPLFTLARSENNSPIWLIYIVNSTQDFWKKIIDEQILIIKICICRPKILHTQTLFYACLFYTFLL